MQNSATLKNKLTLAAVVLTAGFAFAACSPAQSPEQTTTPEMENTMVMDSKKMVAHDSSMSGDVTGYSGEVDPMTGVRTITMEAGAYYYEPNLIRVKKGEKIKIVLNSIAGENMMHDFVIDALNVNSDAAKSGESTTVEFTASEAGTFEYYCSVGDGKHRDNGQVGTLIVE